MKNPFNFEKQFFLTAREYYNYTFVSIKILLTIAIIVVFAMLLLAYFFSLSPIQNKNQLSEYECGFEPFDNATRTPFDVHFYIVGILFLIFDVEIALLFPWVVNLVFMEFIGFFTAFFFIFILAIGFYYEWKIGALNWANKNIKQTTLSVMLILNIGSGSNNSSGTNWWLNLKSATNRFFFETWNLEQWIKTLIVMFFLYWLVFYIYNLFVTWQHKNATKKPYLFTTQSIVILIVTDLLINFAIGIRYMHNDLINTEFAGFLRKCPIAISPLILFVELIVLILYLYSKNSFKMKTPTKNVSLGLLLLTYSDMFNFFVFLNIISLLLSTLVWKHFLIKKTKFLGCYLAQILTLILFSLSLHSNCFLNKSFSICFNEIYSILVKFNQNYFLMSLFLLSSFFLVWWNEKHYKDGFFVYIFNIKHLFVVDLLIASIASLVVFCFDSGSGCFIQIFIFSIEQIVLNRNSRIH